MKTAIDTSVLLSIFNGESDAGDWLQILIEARREGQLVICDVVYAEIAAAFPGEDRLRVQLSRLGVVFEAISSRSAFHAGTIFGGYRAAGGRREHLIPDFLIGAHARIQADRLAAADRGYLRRYFADVSLLAPKRTSA